jgi:hypothetical protein
MFDLVHDLLPDTASSRLGGKVPEAQHRVSRDIGRRAGTKVGWPP